MTGLELTLSLLPASYNVNWATSSPFFLIIHNSSDLWFATLTFYITYYICQISYLLLATRPSLIKSWTYEILCVHKVIYMYIQTRNPHRKYKHNDNKTTWLLLLVVGTTVRPHDFLRPSPIRSALYVVIMFVLVCLCRFLWQIILLTYMRLLTLTLDLY